MSRLQSPPPATPTDAPSPAILAEAGTAAGAAAAVKRKRRIPCERNRRIYEQVVLRERPQSEVAKEFRISQQRVSQIVDRFHDWLKEHLPPGADEQSSQDQLTLAASHAYLRQEYLFGEAMRQLEQSGQPRVVRKTRYSKTGEDLGTHATYYPPSPKSGFMNAALKATQQQWKLAQMAQGLLGRAMEIQFWLPHEHEDQTLCGAEPAAAPAAAAGAAKPAATAAAAAACDPQPNAAEPAQGAHPACAKSCDPPPESHKGEDPKVLWPVGENLRRGPAAMDRNPPSTPAPATSCDLGTHSAGQTQQAAQDRAKSCEATDAQNEGIVPETLVTDDQWVAWLTRAGDRKAKKKQQQKQLARWRARRRAG